MSVIAAPLGLNTGSPWTYAVIAGSIAGSAVLPPLPSESMLATATSLAAAGEPNLPLVCVATTAGALLGTWPRTRWAARSAARHATGRPGPRGAPAAAAPALFVALHCRFDLP